MKPKSVTLSLLVAMIIVASSFVSASAQPAVPTAAVGETIIVRVYYPDLDTGNKVLISFETQLLETDYEEGYHVMEATQEDIDRLRAAGLRVEEDDAWVAPLSLQALAAGIESIPGYSCYRTVEETFASAQALVAAHPKLATWMDAGNSWQKSAGLGGYDMMVLKLTNSDVAGSKPKLFVTAAIHAREYATAELVTRFGEYLVNNYGVDADATWILDHHEVHLLLHTNPDGRKKAETGLSWRKNTNQNYCGAASSNRGADLNRNFSFQWDCCGGSSDSPCDQTYHGASPASEPEIQAVQNYMALLFPDQRGPNLTDPAPLDATGIYIDMHSYGKLVLWPWGFTSTTPPNATGLQTLGRKWAYFNGHTPEQAIGLYVTDGASKDYAYGVLGIPGYTWEVGTAFFQDCTYFTNTLWPANLPALIYAAKVVRTPYMTPAGPDALSLTLSSSEVPAGTPVTLSAGINDTRYNNTNGTEPTQNIAAAEYYADVPPWGASPAAHSMTPSDGSFNAKTEGVTATVDTTGLSTGKHILFVRGKDSSGNWGAFSAIFLTVTGVANQAPTAIAQSVSTAEDTALGIQLTGSDPDGDPLTHSVATGPSHGTLSGTAPNLTYTPAANYNGTDSFTFIVNDGHVDSGPATVSIGVTAVNDAPTAVGQSVTTAEDAAAAITLTGTDVEGSALTFSVQSGPSHGALSGSGPNLTYTPAANYNGLDSFTFKVNDGALDSATATVDITVTSVNDAPAADPQTVAMNEDTAMAITLTGSDVEGSTLAFSVTGGPSHGTLDGTGAVRTYTPAANYNGPDAFEFVANDGLVNSAPAEVSLSVAPVNDAPVATAQSVVTQQDTAIDITLLGTDVEDDPLTFTVQTGPSHGTLSGTGSVLTYTPGAGYTGSDSFTFVAQDVEAVSAPAAVDITVTETNHQPTATAQTVTTDEDAPLAIVLTGSDPDGDELTYAVTTQPLHGVLSGTAPNLTYTPDANYNGTDGFTFVVHDGLVDSAPATVDITVEAVNDAPVANAQVVTTAEDAGAAVTLTGSDVEGSVLAFSVTSGPSHGTLSGSAPDLTYTPGADYNGADSFTFKVSDGALDSASAAVDITVTAVNDAPAADPQTVTTNEDTVQLITLTGSDVEGGALTFSVTGGPSHGTLSGTGANRTYTPAANYNGSDSFTFVVNDGVASSAPAIVSINITPVNDAPVANAQSVTTAQDTATTITLTGSDAEGNALIFSVTGGPSHGTLSGTTGAVLTYTPATGYGGSDSFTFVASDGQADSAPATVSITVTPAAPVLPAAPSGLTATAVSRSQINLKWTDNASNETGFKIERCRSSNCTKFTQIATVAANVTTYSNTGLSSYTYYRYRVRAYNASGNSAYSNIATARTLRR